MSRQFDVLVVGSGAAGLTAALNLAERRARSAVIAKGALAEGATNWAQGGIAAVLEEGDSFAAHVNDTMIAGAGLNDRAVVEHVVGEAPAAIARLAELGVPFNTGDDGNGWHLTREGGHSHRRIVHVADATGWAVQQALESAAAANPNITLIPHMVAVDLITGRHAEEFSTSGAVHGLYAFNRGEEPGRDADRAGDDPRHRRRGPDLSLFDRAARGDRRRDRDGVARRVPRSATWNSCNSTRPASTISRSRIS